MTTRPRYANHEPKLRRILYSSSWAGAWQSWQCWIPYPPKGPGFLPLCIVQQSRVLRYKNLGLFGAFWAPNKERRPEASRGLGGSICAPSWLQQSAFFFFASRHCLTPRSATWAMPVALRYFILSIFFGCLKAGLDQPGKTETPSRRVNQESPLSGGICPFPLASNPTSLYVL